MIEIVGSKNRAICYTNTIDEKSREQIQELCNLSEFADSKIRIMPDVHAGKGCVIGTSMTITNKVVPSMVGVDIGCGMETVKIAERDVDYAEVDKLIRNLVPDGFNVRKTPHEYAHQIDLQKLRIADKVNLDRAVHSVGTLGGGNHFIEIGRSESGDLYLVVHSGSRHLGHEIATYYQNEAYKALVENPKKAVAKKIEQLKSESRHGEIADTVKAMKSGSDLPKHFAYLTGALLDDYLHDMSIAQRYATLNRKAIADVILQGMKLTESERFTTIHNYIDTGTMILRKGAVSAKTGEKLLIPINMRDGSLICAGKGNEDWNQTAPHGAGRLMSRTAALEKLSIADFESEMENIYTTSVNKETLDEAPMAYKKMSDITDHISPTADIVERIIPEYNYKSS